MENKEEFITDLDRDIIYHQNLLTKKWGTKQWLWSKELDKEVKLSEPEKILASKIGEIIMKINYIAEKEGWSADEKKN